MSTPLSSRVTGASVNTGSGTTHGPDFRAFGRIAMARRRGSHRRSGAWRTASVLGMTSGSTTNHCRKSQRCWSAASQRPPWIRLRVLPEQPRLAADSTNRGGSWIADLGRKDAGRRDYRPASVPRGAPMPLCDQPGGGPPNTVAAAKPGGTGSARTTAFRNGRSAAISDRAGGRGVPRAWRRRPATARRPPPLPHYGTRLRPAPCRRIRRRSVLQFRA